MTSVTALRARALRGACLLLAVIALAAQSTSAQINLDPGGIIGGGGTTPNLVPNLSLSGITVAYGDWETVQGQFTLTNVSDLAQSITIGSVGVVMEYVGESGASAPCRAVSFFPDAAPGATVLNGLSLPVKFTAVCTDATLPADAHEIVSIVTVKVLESDQVFATSGRSHL